MAFRKFLFQLHLWVGLILGVVFVLLGLSGSIGLLRPLLTPIPVVQAVAAKIPALDAGLAAARAAIAVPSGAVADIQLPQDPGDAVRFHFRAPYGSGVQMSVDDALTDPASGRLLATYRDRPPELLTLITGFHSRLLIPNGRRYNGLLGLGMVFLGLSGFYLWWPRRGHWRVAFSVRRKAKGLRFHRELHGAVGIWTLAMFLIVTVTGTAICFPMLNRGVIAFLTEGRSAVPRIEQEAPIVVPPKDARAIGPDAALAAARGPAGDRPVISIALPPDRSQAISVTAGMPGDLPIYVDPYRGSILAGNMPRPTRVDDIQRAVGRLHEAYGFGLIYQSLVFLSGFLPLIFFVTGIAMWWKKRQNRLAMNQPLPPDLS